MTSAWSTKPVSFFFIVAILVVMNGEANAAVTDIATNDNRVPAGRLGNGALLLDLVADEGLWYPETKDGPGLRVQALGEQGKGLSIPAPMVRVREGTRIQGTVRNNLSSPLVLHGFHTKPGNASHKLTVASGETATFDFVAGRPGTYLYYGSTMRGSGVLDNRPLYTDTGLAGAFVVDPAEVPVDPAERIFVINLWHESPELDARFRDRSLPQAARDEAFNQQRVTHTINGLTWPYTERLAHQRGQRVKWRWINASYLGHPLHLHGFYFDVLAAGDGEQDHVYAPNVRPKVVTHLVLPGHTMTMEWNAERPGNWLFHCHMVDHISPRHRLRPRLSHSAEHQHSAKDHVNEEMAGLVLGVHVKEDQTALTPVPAVKRRHMTLIAQEQPNRFGTQPAFGYQLREGTTSAPADKVSIPGPTIFLRRDEPTSINIVNKTSEPTSVHWHGIELESYFDGVPGWGVTGSSITPMIGPGESFIAQMTPPRAGTFMYHTHSHDDKQISSGMYGALVVLPPGERHNADTDRIFLLSRAGPLEHWVPPPEAPVFLNGSEQPELPDLRVGTTYRFRLINITSDNAQFSMHLLKGTEYVHWRAIAKDGADLPASQTLMLPAHQTVSVGETRDFEYRPDEAGELTFEVRTGRNVTRLKTSLRVHP